MAKRRYYKGYGKTYSQNVIAKLGKEANHVHIPLVRYAKYLGLRPIHIPNEGKQTDAERISAKAMGVEGGESDLIFLEERCGYSGLILECKASADYVLTKKDDFRQKKNIQDQLQFILSNYKNNKLGGFVWSFEMGKNILDSYVDNNRQLADKYIEKQRYITILEQQVKPNQIHHETR